MLTNKTVVLGITGGIASYKGADLASKMNQAGAKVHVILTKSAREFITPLTVESLTNNAVITDIFQSSATHHANHIAFAEMADILIIAPATANIIAKIAHGIADDMLSCTVLATKAPVVIAPAMHTCMWEKPITQENVARLKDRGFFIIEPAGGRLASGGYGPGRFPETEFIIGHIKKILGRNGDLAGKKILVTAGGTQEPIDPVRFMGNRSSGKMGYALAEAARDRGAQVTLISTPTAIASPVGVTIISVETASQMKEAVGKAVTNTDALIMAAAVADYQVAEVARQKIKKESGDLTLKLVRTADILTETKGDFIKVGFAAETQDLIVNARKKIEQKKLDLIAGNDVTEQNCGFGADNNKVTLIGKDGNPENLPVMSKREVADRILDRVVRLFKEKSNPLRPNA
jgi:phosphopantothenoylcysteine decarboxylase/phosphopantothenate--cysteine ligase